VILALAVVVGGAYALAWPRRLKLVGAGRRWQLRHWQAAAFACGLLVAAAACAPPVEGLVERAFSVQAAQWTALVTVAAPLLVAGAPAAMVHRLHPPRAGIALPVAWLGPSTGFLLVNAGLWLSALPLVEETVLRLPAARAAQELALLLLGVLFWAQVIDQRPLRARLTLPQRAAFLFLASAQQRVLALLLGFAQAPFFDHYVRLSGRPSALADQQLGAGILLVPGVLTDTIVLAICIFLWLAEGLAPARGWHPPGVGSSLVPEARPPTKL
jgi:cytochrome c oxidase assembly factor CtaG